MLKLQSDWNAEFLSLAQGLYPYSPDPFSLLEGGVETTELQEVWYKRDELEDAVAGAEEKLCEKDELNNTR